MVILVVSENPAVLVLKKFNRLINLIFNQYFIALTL